MNKFLVLCIVFLFLIFSEKVIAVEPSGGIIVGRIVDAVNQKGLEYVTIAIFDKKNDQLIGGVVTQQDGRFRIENIERGEYYIYLSFIGYSSKRINSIFIEDKNKLDLGTIVLGESMESIEQVEVIAERDAIEFKLDKKIINVSKQFTSISGSAVDVLQNVPSVTVDIDGNVSLRGSTGFTVLVDGIPSMFEPSEMLQQIPASSIENIEIITNPSVKYDPDGTVGIINVTTKRKGLAGINGTADMKLGTNNIGGGFLFNLKKGKATYFIGADYNYGDYPGDKHGYRNSFSTDTVYKVAHDGSIGSRYDRYNFKGGIELKLDTLKSFYIDINYSGRDRNSMSNLNYKESNSFTSDIISYKSSEDVNRASDGVAINSTYLNKFKEVGHELKFSLSYWFRNGDEENINNLYDSSSKKNEGRRNIEKGPMRRWQAKLDYIKPIGENLKFEVGYQSTLKKSEDNTGLFIDSVGNGVYVEDIRFNNSTDYQENIHATYLLLANQTSKFGYQLGIRSEYTKRNVELKYSGDVSLINNQSKSELEGFDYFPSAHLSLKLPLRQELMTSYSRRIDRVRSYHFEPFYTWVDAYNIRRGNPDLLPEYTNSFELNYIKKYDNAYLSLETYYQVVKNKIEWVRSVYENSTIQRYPENVGKGYYWGIDGTYSFDLRKWWRVDLSGSFYNYKVKGEWGQLIFDEDNFTWNYRINQTFKLNSLTQLQSNWRYYSRRITSQGFYEPVYTLDIAFKKQLFNRKLSGVVELRDVFATNNRENTNEGIGFKDYYFQMIHTPVLTFTFTYRFNNYKPNKRRSSEDENFGGVEIMD